MVSTNNLCMGFRMFLGWYTGFEPVGPYGTTCSTQVALNHSANIAKRRKQDSNLHTSSSPMTRFQDGADTISVNSSMTDSDFKNVVQVNFAVDTGFEHCMWTLGIRQ